MKKLKDSTIEGVQIYLNRISGGIYSVSNGVLLNKNMTAIGWVSKNGYMQLSLGKKKIYLHQVLFAYYFGIEKLISYESVNHIDGNKLNNLESNMEGMSLSENSSHQHQIGLSSKGSECSYAIIDEEIVKQILKLLKLGVQQHRIAEYYGINRSTVMGIHNGSNWKDVIYDDDVQVPFIDNKRKKRKDSTLTGYQVNQIRKLLKIGCNQSRIAEYFDISRGLILSIKIGRGHKEVELNESVDIPIIENYRATRKDLKLNQSQVNEITLLLDSGELNKTEIGKIYGASRNTVLDILRGTYPIKPKEKELADGISK